MIFSKPLRIASKMKFNFQFYAKLANGKVEPVSQKPLTLDFPSVDKARELILARSLAQHERAPDSVSIESEDRTISERWYQVDGTWSQSNQNF